MGVTIVNSTIPDGVTPICNKCGVCLCWDISTEKYLSQKTFWDDWVCKECKELHKTRV